MSFFFGLIVGVLFGIGIIVAFVNCENTRSKKRTDLAAAIAAFARMTVEDSRKLLPAEYYPFLGCFLTKAEGLKWLNLELTKIWPYVNEAASELIRTNVEPVLEQYRPVILSSLKFSKLTLGTVAPQFTGVSIVEDCGEGITMELELQWDGNPSIVLDIKTRVGVALPVQVKNVAFTGVFRLIFRPLVDEFPCFGAVCYSLREKKKMDFTLKVVGGDISSIPGIYDAIEGTIRDAIEDSLTWPVRKVVPILPGDYSDLELKPVGTLEVKLVQAKELTNKDIIGKSDPYAVLYVRPLRDRTKKSKTIVGGLIFLPSFLHFIFFHFLSTLFYNSLQNNQLNPVWNEHFEFVVEDASTQHLVVKIFDDEGLQASELIGCAQVRLKDLEPGKVKDIWLKLVKDLEVQRDNKNRGQVSAQNSSVVNESLNPVWNQTFDFVVEDGLHDMLILEVYDHDTFGKDHMGRCILTLTRVILEGEYKDSLPIDGTKSGKLNLHLKWAPQPIYRDN
ncbi:hypothetical protein IFM89_033195 [Coptis chinensis]|uniref:Synaptotagmin-5 n=1 Tax=Coptis chinensis TaxID=261450 RepID=A0A835IDU0_9MAGN|nr:hypothetical protein IFM89_033195 [Coptis chinensis]